MTIRILLFSDLHLERPFRWASTEGRRRRRQGLRDTLRRVVALAGELRVDAVCCGGDLYEHEHFVADTGPFLHHAFAALHPTPVLLVPGNHDWYGPASLYHHVEWSPNVVVFRDVELRPWTLVDGCTVWGAAHQAPAGTASPLTGFTVDRGGTNLGLFHGSEMGGFAAVAAQDRTKVPHAPFRAEDIATAGLDHVLLGHHHRPTAGALHTYPGNPDPLDFGEDGERGAVLLSVDDGRITRQWYPVASTEVADVALELTGVDTVDEARQRARDVLAGHRGFVRLTVSGEVADHLTITPLDLGREQVAPHLDELVVRTDSLTVAVDLQALAAERSIRGELVRRALAAEDLDDELRLRVIVTGLRALAGRRDLAVP